jgi:hypothetical protein
MDRPQTFKLMYQESFAPMSDDLNRLPEDEIKRLMDEAIAQAGWTATGDRVVAIGSWGDCVVYDRGEITLISDSH